MGSVKLTEDVILALLDSLLPEHRYLSTIQHGRKLCTYD
jgi:hypothetical protein